MISLSDILVRFVSVSAAKYGRDLFNDTTLLLMVGVFISVSVIHFGKGFLEGFREEKKL